MDGNSKSCPKCRSVMINNSVSVCCYIDYEIHYYDDYGNLELRVQSREIS